MKRTIAIGWGNLKTGLVLTVAIVALLWASFTGAGTSIFSAKGKFVCYFQNVNGLVSGSPVWMAGVEVGNVKSVKFVHLDSLRQIKVICRVKKSVWVGLTQDAGVQLGTIGFVGDKFLEIVPGTIGKPPIEEMGVVRTLHVGSAGEMFKAGEEAMDNAATVIQELDTMLTRMNRGDGTLGRLANDEELYTGMTKLIGNLTKLVGSLEANQERLVASIEKTSDALSDVSGQVSKNTGTLGKVINDPALYDNLTATSAQLDSIMLKINSAEGTLGLFVNDTALYSEFTNLMVRVGNLVTDIEENPRKYFKFSVF